MVLVAIGFGFLLGIFVGGQAIIDAYKKHAEEHTPVECGGKVYMMVEVKE